MFTRKKVSDENIAIARPNKWFLVRHLILLLLNKLLNNYLLRIDLLDNKYSDLSNYDVKGYEINGPRSLSTRSRSL